MKDPAQLLTAQGENTNTWRVIKFTDVSEIIRLESTIEKYLLEADRNRSKIKS